MQYLFNFWANTSQERHESAIGRHGSISFKSFSDRAFRHSTSPGDRGSSPGTDRWQLARPDTRRPDGRRAHHDPLLLFAQAAHAQEGAAQVAGQMLAVALRTPDAREASVQPAAIQVLVERARHMGAQRDMLVLAAFGDRWPRRRSVRR